MALRRVLPAISWTACGGGGAHSPRGCAKIRAGQHASEPLACLGERDDLKVVSNLNP